jgi:hypothetical protein
MGRRERRSAGRPAAQQPGESDAAYGARLQTALANATRENAVKKAGQAVAVGLVGLVAAGCLYLVLSAALAGVLAVPGMVGYRDMASPAQPSGG